MRKERPRNWPTKRANERKRERERETLRRKRRIDSREGERILHAFLHRAFHTSRPVNPPPIPRRCTEEICIQDLLASPPWLLRPPAPPRPLISSSLGHLLHFPRVLLLLLLFLLLLLLSLSSFSFFDAIVTRLRGDSGGGYSPPLALYLDSQRNPFECFKSRKEFCSTIRQTSKGTNRSYSLRGTIETISFKLPILSATLNMR